MAFERLASEALLALSSLLGVGSLANPAGTGWTIDSPWTEANGHLRFEASSEEIPKLCQEMPEGHLSFPMVIHGAHTFALDGKIVLLTADPEFKTTTSFYGNPELSCKQIAGGKRLVWRVDSYTRYFARISRFPKPTMAHSAHDFFAETVHVIGAGGALILAIFTLVIFIGKVRLPLALSVSGSCLGASVYFASVVSGFFGLSWPMFIAHKTADVGVWVAIFLILNALRLEGLVPFRYFVFYAANVALGIAIILFGRSGDEIQLGTSLPFGAVLPLLTMLLIRILNGRSGDWNRSRLLYALTLCSFIAVCFSEMLVVLGLSNLPPLLPIGFLFGVIFFALALNERIAEAYRERDYLRSNLEGEVARKTQELQTAMSTLRSTQAELVQSAKLASLGVLSAGIAHEINNSLNYVNGAMHPLERMVLRLTEKSASPEDRPKIEKLLAVMKEGLQLTLEIIRSLRSHAGLNQAKFNDVKLRDAASSSLAILRSRTRGKIEVDLAIPEDLSVFGSVVGLNQVFMNLISNGIDAMAESGRLSIEGESEPGGEWATVRVRDTGCGMSPQTSARIFEPFFTTKDVGQGTGLGLHIVRGEVEKHGGTIAVESEVGKGTCFTIRLPTHNEKVAAA